jgi:hypothetical protein
MHPASRIKGLEVAAPGSVVEGAGVELGGNVDIGDNVEFGGCDVCCAAVWLEDDTGVEVGASTLCTAMIKFTDSIERPSP